MANQEHLRILNKGIEDWKRWRKDNSSVIPLLSGADLSGADLSGADLSGADLSGADLSGANIFGTNFHNANLSKVNLSRACRDWPNQLNNRDNGLPDINATDFSAANLSGATLSEAFLSSAIFVQTNLANTDCARAIFGMANFDNANFIGANLCQANLERAFLSNSMLCTANLSGAKLSNATLDEVDLQYANLSGAICIKAHFVGADISSANLNKTVLQWANLTCATLINTNLLGADLYEADLTEADFTKANLVGANLFHANLRDAILVEANLTNANLIGTNFLRTHIKEAILNNCKIYGINVWDCEGELAEQNNLIITPDSQLEVTVDNIKIAQFIYLLLENKEIRDAIDTLTSKAVLILGRFTEERKAVLDAIKNELRKRNYLPILFDFEKPASKDLTETIMTLASISKFVIADITDAKSIPQELSHIVPNLPSLAVVPILLEAQREYAMFEHFGRYPWVLPVYTYPTIESLLLMLNEKVIDPAERKVEELRPRK